MIRVVIPDSDHDFLPIPDLGSRIPDPDLQHWSVVRILPVIKTCIALDLGTQNTVGFFLKNVPTVSSSLSNAVQRYLPTVQRWSLSIESLTVNANGKTQSYSLS